MGVYCLDGCSFALCTDGDYSCLFYQVLKHERSAGAIFHNALQGILTNGLVKTVNQPDVLRNVVQFLFGTEEALFGVPKISTLMQSLAENWLKDIDRLVAIDDAKLLRRYIPSLSIHSLKKVVNFSRLDLIGSCGPFEPQSDEEIIEHIAMRRFLSIMFARLAPCNTDIDEVHKRWQTHFRNAEVNGMLQPMLVFY